MSENYFNFSQAIWEDRVSAYPNRRKLTEVGASTSVSYTVERDDDPVTTDGTPFNASTMNDLENRIANISINNATNSVAGLMSASDKSKLDSISANATKNTISSGTSAPSDGNNGDIYLRYS